MYLYTHMIKQSYNIHVHTIHIVVLCHNTLYIQCTSHPSKQLIASKSQRMHTLSG